MALEMKPTCERCGVRVEPNGEAYICTNECTFCPRCTGEMHGICPNCRGELVPRPRRLTPTDNPG